jgi:hypothetical protein
MTEMVAAVQTGTEVLVVRIPGGISRLRDLVTALTSISEIHSFSWKLAVGIDALISPAENVSPAASPFPPTAPDLRVDSIEQGSLVIRLTVDLASGADLGMGAVGASGALWLLYRILKRGPRAAAQFIAEVLSTRTLVSTHRTRLRREQQVAEFEELTARRGVAEARVAEWLAQDRENKLWLQYQALLNAAPDLEVRVVDQDGRDLEEPSTSSSG